MNKRNIKVLFFIGTLSSGGKERRLLELITYLNKSDKYALFLVTKQAEVLFDNFYSLQVEWLPLSTSRLTIGSFSEFYSIVRKVSPDIIHTWGSRQTLIAIPPKLLFKKLKLVNSQITSAPPSLSITETFLSKLNFLFSDVILSNSIAGIDAYGPPKDKAMVIYNGLNLNRFEHLPDKTAIRDKFNIKTKYAVIMVATYSKNKDYERFFSVGKALSNLRTDTTFVGVGFFGDDGTIFRNISRICEGNDLLRPIPGTKEVEALVNACDLGVLFSNAKVHGEGISNAVIEYMALGKPVFANDAGGTREVVVNDWNGFLFDEESDSFIAAKIDSLLNSPEKLALMGFRSKEKIMNEFTLERMGAEFEKVYNNCLFRQKS